MIVEVELCQSRLYLSFIEIISALWEQLEVVLVGLPAKWALGYDELENTLVQERPLLQDVRLLDLQQQELTYFWLFLDMDLRCQVVMQVAFPSHAHLLVELSQHCITQKFFIFGHLLPVNVEEGPDHFVEFLRLIEIHSRYFQVILTLKVPHFYFFCHCKCLWDEAVNILLDVGVAEVLGDNCTGQFSL